MTGGQCGWFHASQLALPQLLRSKPWCSIKPLVCHFAAAFPKVLTISNALTTPAGGGGRGGSMDGVDMDGIHAGIGQSQPRQRSHRKPRPIPQQ
jgi:hypothetical protein